MTTAQKIERRLKGLGNKADAEQAQRFFKGWKLSLGGDINNDTIACISHRIGSKHLNL